MKGVYHNDRIRQVPKLVHFLIGFGCMLKILFQPMEAVGQDTQFSQFYAAPLYLNPAFAGANNRSRAGLNYRIQWPGLARSFITESVYLDYFSEYISGGLGLIATRNEESLLGFKSLEIGGLYSLKLRLSNTTYLRTGVQYAFISKGVDFDKLLFGDQIDLVNGSFRDRSGEILNLSDNLNLGSWSLGSVIYGEAISVGLSVHHLNEPNQSFIGAESRLDRKYSLHARYVEPFPGSDEHSVIYSLNLKSQGGLTQMDLGFQWLLKSFMLAARYRGIPVDRVGGLKNHESLVLMAGANLSFGDYMEDLAFAISYDVTVSELADLGGAYEFSLILEFGNSNKFRKRETILPCPKTL